MTQMLTTVPPTSRVGRYPKHTFLVNSLPFTLQPISIARVLPSETVNNLYLESRVVTDPIKNPIIGWKKEFYFFYVRASDLLADAIRDMFIDPTNAEITTAVEAANSQTWYTGKGAVNWMKLCTKRVCETYFRDEGETAEAYQTAAGIPIVQIRESTFMDSLTDKDLMPTGGSINLAEAQTMEQLDQLLDAYNVLRSMSLADMTYEDFLRSYGINIPNKDENKPELIARFSDWQYPTNHIATNAENAGQATSAVSWVFRNHARDPKFIKEPGFIVGYSIARPKVYFGGLTGSALGWAKRAWDWMPNYLRGMPETQLKKFALDTGPLGERSTDADAYWLDMRDELLHGDQWQNVAAFNNAAATPASHLVPLPLGTNIKWKYPTEAVCKSFMNVDTGVIKQDGMLSISIKGFEVDYTKGNVAQV